MAAVMPQSFKRIRVLAGQYWRVHFKFYMLRKRCEKIVESATIALFLLRDLAIEIKPLGLG
jgi:hypothetical protein